MFLRTNKYTHTSTHFVWGQPKCALNTACCQPLCSAWMCNSAPPSVETYWPAALTRQSRKRRQRCNIVVRFQPHLVLLLGRGYTPLSKGWHPEMSLLSLYWDIKHTFKEKKSDVWGINWGFQPQSSTHEHTPISHYIKTGRHIVSVLSFDQLRHWHF